MGNEKLNRGRVLLEIRRQSLLVFVTEEQHLDEDKIGSYAFGLYSLKL